MHGFKFELCGAIFSSMDDDCASSICEILRNLHDKFGEFFFISFDVIQTLTSMYTSLLEIPVGEMKKYSIHKTLVCIFELYITQHQKNKTLCDLTQAFN